MSRLVHPFTPGDVILKRKATIPCIYIILSGQVGVTRDTGSSYQMQATDSESVSRIFQDEISFMYPGDYFGEEKFLRSVEKSSRTFVAVNEVTLCVISQALFDDEKIFGAVKTWIKNDVSLRERVNSVRALRIQKRLMRVVDSVQPHRKEMTSTLQSIWALADGAPHKLSTAVRTSSIRTVSSDGSSSSDTADGLQPISKDNTAACNPCPSDVMCCSLSHDASPVPSM